jgi:hypothetical protein
MKHFGFSGLWQHLPTTILGLALVGGGVYSVLTAKTTWADALGAVTTGAGLLGIAFKGSAQ